MTLDFTYTDGTRGKVLVSKVNGHFTYADVLVVNPQPPTPPPAGFTPLTFNAGTQTFKDSLGPGQSKCYAFTVLPGITGFSMNISLITQIANLDMVLAKGDGVNSLMLAGYLDDALAYYNANSSLWSTPYFKKYPISSVWAKIGTDFGGEGIYIKTSTKTPPVDSPAFAASVPGTYYVIVKNQSKTVGASFYVYAKQ